MPPFRGGAAARTGTSQPRGLVWFWWGVAVRNAPLAKRRGRGDRNYRHNNDFVRGTNQVRLQILSGRACHSGRKTWPVCAGHRTIPFLPGRNMPSKSWEMSHGAVA